MNKNVIIIGASGHGEVVADIVLKSNDNLIGFLDDNEKLKEFAGYPVLGKTSNYINFLNNYFVIAIGNPEIREDFANKITNQVKWYIGIHPSAQISSMNVSIGEGSVIMANAVINSNTFIGKHCIINTSAVVEHDNKIHDFAHISVGAKLGGTVEIGKSTWIGIGATVNNNIHICGNCMVGAGAVVVSDISKKGVYIGVPAKSSKIFRRKIND